MAGYFDFSWVENFVTRDTILGHPLDDVFSFRTPKVVRIQDRLLGGADLVIRLLIAVFVVVVLLIGQQGYVAKESVVGTAAFTLDGDFHGLNMSAMAYCQDGNKCRFVDEHVVRGGGGGDVNKGHLFVATIISEREQKRECDADAEVCNRNSAFKSVTADTFYVAGIDDFVIKLQHEAMAPTFYAKKHDERYHGTDRDMEGKLVSYRDDGTGRVRMVDLQDIDRSHGLMLSVSELLDAAGLDLDKPLPRPDGEDQDADGDGIADGDGSSSKWFGVQIPSMPNMGASSAQSPPQPQDFDDRPLRQTGVVIDCHIRYYNDWAMFSPAPAVKYEVEFAPAANQNAMFSSAYEVVGFGDARMMVKRSGVYVRVLHEGQLVSFSMVETLQTLAIGFMLMYLSSWIVAQVATRWLPLADRYETHKYEYTENIYNLRVSRDEFNDRVIEPQCSMEQQIQRSLMPKGKGEEGMKDYSTMEPRSAK